MCGGESAVFKIPAGLQPGLAMWMQGQMLYACACLCSLNLAARHHLKAWCMQAQLYLGFVQRRVHEQDILQAAAQHGLAPCQVPAEADLAGFVGGVLRLLAFRPANACEHLDREGL